jgi:hypothetical protein
MNVSLTEVGVVLLVLIVVGIILLFRKFSTRPVKAETLNQPLTNTHTGVAGVKNSKLAIGIIILIVGIALIVISQTDVFLQTSNFMGMSYYSGENTSLKHATLFGGIACLILGGVFLALGLQKQKDTN